MGACYCTTKGSHEGSISSSRQQATSTTPSELVAFLCPAFLIRCLLVFFPSHRVIVVTATAASHPIPQLVPGLSHRTSLSVSWQRASITQRTIASRQPLAYTVPPSTNFSTALPKESLSPSPTRNTLRQTTLTKHLSIDLYAPLDLLSNFDYSTHSPRLMT